MGRPRGFVVSAQPNDGASEQSKDVKLRRYRSEDWESRKQGENSYQTAQMDGTMDAIYEQISVLHQS